VLIGALWGVVGLRTGVWAPGFLLSVLVLTFFFAVLYAVSALYGVLTRSPVVAILVTCLAWFLFWLVGTLYPVIEDTKRHQEFPEWVYPTIETLHAVLPRTKDLDLLMARVLSRELLADNDRRSQGLDKLPEVTWGESLTISGAFVTVLLGVACWRFYRKDY
jgi:hypothetical protein